MLITPYICIGYASLLLLNTIHVCRFGGNDVQEISNVSKRSFHDFLRVYCRRINKVAKNSQSCIT